MIRKYFSLVIILFLFNFSFSQTTTSNVIIIPTSTEFFTPCGNTYFEVYARQSKPITLDKIKAKVVKFYKIIEDSIFVPVTEDLTIEEIGNNKFKLLPINTLGTIEFEIELENGVEKIKHEIAPMSVTLYLSNYNLSDNKPLKLQKLKNTTGITASLNNKATSGYGKVLQFSVIGIINGKAEPEILNKGARFNAEVKNMISRLNINDRIIIKDLFYRSCLIRQQYKSDFVITLK